MNDANIYLLNYVYKRNASWPTVTAVPTCSPHSTTVARSRGQDAKADMFHTSLDHGMRDVCPDNEMIEWCISLHVPGAASERDDLNSTRLLAMGGGYAHTNTYLPFWP